MPLYEFRCRECGADAELFAVAGETPPPCPVCGAVALERRYSQISPPARIGLRGRAARESDGRRAEREAARRERAAERRKKRHR